MDTLKMTDIGKEKWEEYLNKIEGSSFCYTAQNAYFQIEYAEHVIANESFIGIQDNQPLVVANVYIYEDEKGVRSISWGKRYCPAPIVDQRLPYAKQEKYIKWAMKEIEKIKETYQCREIYLKFEPIANAHHQCKVLNYNYLIKYGYEDSSSLTQVLDLRRSVDELRGEVTQNHRRNIKKVKDKFTFEFYDSKNVTEEILQLYRSIYEYDAGRVTRNSEMTHHYYQFAKDGNAIVGLAKYNQEYVAVVVCTMYKNMAYYSSYAEKADMTDGNAPGHILHWETIKYLKEHGIDFYEMGEQVFGEYPKGTEEEKLVNISKFKRGFGGYTVPMFRGRKVSVGETDEKI